jgi:hypothetical protein
MDIFELKAEAPQVRRWMRWLTYLLKVRQVFVLAIFFHVDMDRLRLGLLPRTLNTKMVYRHMPTNISIKYSIQSRPFRKRHQGPGALWLEISRRALLSPDAM